MANTNCLEGMSCPKCRSEEPFRIASTVFTVVYDDGVDEYVNPEWDDDSTCFCTTCGTQGTVGTFKKVTVTVVVFRVFKENNEVIALFPLETWDQRGRCTSYMHVGQHGGADYYGLLKTTRLAKPREYAKLKRELENIGYRLRILKRRPPWKLSTVDWHTGEAH